MNLLPPLPRSLFSLSFHSSYPFSLYLLLPPFLFPHPFQKKKKKKKKKKKNTLLHQLLKCHLYANLIYVGVMLIEGVIFLAMGMSVNRILLRMGHYRILTTRAMQVYEGEGRGGEGRGEREEERRVFFFFFLEEERSSSFSFLFFFFFLR